MYQSLQDKIDAAKAGHKVIITPADFKPPDDQIFTITVADITGMCIAFNLNYTLTDTTLTISP